MRFSVQYKWGTWARLCPTSINTVSSTGFTCTSGMCRVGVSEISSDPPRNLLSFYRFEIATNEINHTMTSAKQALTTKVQSGSPYQLDTNQVYNTTCLVVERSY